MTPRGARAALLPPRAAVVIDIIISCSQYYDHGQSILQFTQQHNNTDDFTVLTHERVLLNHLQSHVS